MNFLDFSGHYVRIWSVTTDTLIVCVFELKKEPISGALLTCFCFCGYSGAAPAVVDEDEFPERVPRSPVSNDAANNAGEISTDMQGLPSKV